MKTQKLLSLDWDIVNRLKEEDNASRLVNSLLEKHYSLLPNKRKPEDIEEERKNLMKKAGELENQYKDMMKEINADKDKIAQEEAKAQEQIKRNKELTEKWKKETPVKERTIESWKAFKEKHE